MKAKSKGARKEGAASTKGAEGCACFVRAPFLGSVASIEFCPMHDAAPGLYEALRLARTWVAAFDYEDRAAADLSRIDAALARATGKGE